MGTMIAGGPIALGQHDFRLASLQLQLAGEPPAHVKPFMVCARCLQRMNEAFETCPGTPLRSEAIEEAVSGPQERMVTR